MRMMELPQISDEVAERAPFTPTAGDNDGVVRDFHGRLVADTDGHMELAESIARLLNAAALYMR